MELEHNSLIKLDSGERTEYEQCHHYLTVTHIIYFM